MMMMMRFNQGDIRLEYKTGQQEQVFWAPAVTNPLLLLSCCFQVIVTGIEVCACAALYLMFPRQTRVDAPKLLAMDSCDIHFSSGAIQWVETDLRAGVR
jgi:hypothetical protein